MDGSLKKSASLEILVIQNITNVHDLKIKLNDIIKAGKDYEYDVSPCLKSLLNNSDHELLLLTIQAISELAKCDSKREAYAQKDIIQSILNVLNKEVTTEKYALIKQCCRALGNLCCDCDIARKRILENHGVQTLIKLLKTTVGDNTPSLNEIKMLASQTLLNFAIGGAEFSDVIVKEGIIEILQTMLVSEQFKEEMDDDMVSTVLLILSVINDDTPEFLFDEGVNVAVLNVLKETSSIAISEQCLDHLHTQAEHDSVKTLLAKEDGVQLVCNRLEILMNRHNTGDLNVEDTDIESIAKQACDLVIIVLTGDEPMHMLYNKGVGEVYLCMIKWLDSTDYHLLSTAVLAIGNFARQDDYCSQMMDDKIFDKLLDIFEVYHGFSINVQKEPDKIHPIDPITITKIEHAVLSALRNLLVPVSNKRVAAAKGRAIAIFLAALPDVEDHHVAYKLLAAIRMLVDGQEGVARAFAANSACVSATCRWGRAREHAGAAGEAPRLLAWCTKLLNHSPHHMHTLIKIEGCISSLVNMLVASHSIMQNEAILALTLLAIEALNNKTLEDHDFDCEKTFTTHLVNSEIGKHVSVLLDTNCAKIPVEVAENLLAFLDISAKKNELSLDYKEAKVHEALIKFMDARNDLNQDLRSCLAGVVKIISGNTDEE